MIDADPLEIFDRGLKSPDALAPDELLVYICMELETYAEMEGWDCFFTTDKMRLYPVLKRGLAAAGDEASLKVLEGYEGYLHHRGVALEATAIGMFLDDCSNGELDRMPDWRAQFMELCEVRWRRIAAYLQRRGIVLKV